MIKLQPFEYKDLRLEVIDAENIVKIGTIFTFQCRVTNTAEHAMKLHVSLDTKVYPDCPYTGSAEFVLDVLQPGEMAEFPLTICPSKLGLIKVSPLLLVDTLRNEQYVISKVVEVFVVDADYHQDGTFLLNKLIRYENPIDSLIQKQVQLQVV